MYYIRVNPVKIYLLLLLNVCSMKNILPVMKQVNFELSNNQGLLVLELAPVF